MKRLTSEQLTEIAASITGPRLGFWIPASYRRTLQRTGAQFIVVRAHSDLTGKPPSAADLWEALVTTQFPPAIVALSMINLLIERFSPRLDLEQALSTKFLNPNLSSEVETRQTGPQPDYRLIFNRIGVLAALKGLIGVPKDSKEKGPYQDHQIGLLILSQRFHHQSRSPTNRQNFGRAGPGSRVASYMGVDEPASPCLWSCSNFFTDLALPR